MAASLTNNSEDLREVVSSTSRAVLTKSGNRQRAEWRAKTRRVLADHLKARLGMSVKPGDVRLVPRTGDGYVWAALPEKQYLFSKQLSKHSIGTYIELCRGVGVFFEALTDSESGKTSTAVPQGEKNVVATAFSAPAVSFTSRIQHLQADHDRLAHELDRLREKTREDLITRQEKDEKIKQLQSDLQVSRKYAQQLEHENTELSSNAKYFKNRAVKSGKVLNEVLPALQELSAEPPVSPWRESVTAAGQRELQDRLSKDTSPGAEFFVIVMAESETNASVGEFKRQMK